MLVEIALLVLLVVLILRIDAKPKGLPPGKGFLY